MAHINDELCLDDLDEDLDENTTMHTAENLTFNFTDNNLDDMCKLQKSEHYKEVMNRVEEALLRKNHTLVLREEDPEYQLVHNCNALLVDIETEIVTVHRIIRDIYRSKFPELESIVPHPIDYATIVKTIGNVTDLTLVDLQGILPSATIMVLSITVSTTSGKPLPEKNLQKVIDACDLIFSLDLAKKKLLDYLETRMGCIAPNLSAIVGSVVAAKLLGIAGGLSALGRMASCNVQLLGAKRKSMTFTTSKILHVGFLQETEIFQTTPPSLRNEISRVLANKSALAARVDSNRHVDSKRRYLKGEYGRTLRDEICKKIEKSQELPPAKQPKPLPIPDYKPRNKRGGCRFRKTKEKYAVTEMRKCVNRMQFGVPEESSLGDGLGFGYGLLGQCGSGKLRLPKGQGKRLGVKGARKFQDKHCGITSRSMAFTPMQGIELINPLQAHSDIHG